METNTGFRGPAEATNAAGAVFTYSAYVPRRPRARDDLCDREYPIGDWPISKLEIGG